uniref:Disintegrin and metalloproteinase domain-containing protein 10 n=1 Tax=Sinocyclocheilus grahami TaxID=75366 RepID=A0A672NW75_SINGR
HLSFSLFLLLFCLSYDTDILHSKHQRAKRALSHQDQFLHLDFHAHGRHFNLRMKRDTSLFAPDLKVEVSGEEIPYDTSHIYTGEIYGEKGSLTHGSIVDGKFEGFIKSHKGTYYVEPSERYLKDQNVPYHSVIYHEDDIGELILHCNDLHHILNHHLFNILWILLDYIDIFSKQTHFVHCLSTVRGSSGGICEKNKHYSDGKRKSLNTGIITVQNYASHVPSKVSHITFAHEVGHNFGSPHDSGSDCTPGESKTQDQKEKGNYIMYARATSGDKFNNNKFSICSIHNISQVLDKKRYLCFVESGQPICGNGMVEANEQCDCGYSDQCKDKCCYDASAPEGLKCKLKPDTLCSPSQGPCCTPECTFKFSDVKCREESECALKGMCSGNAAQCPTSTPKENFTSCHTNSQVCLNGVCSGSICQKYGLDVCTCATEEGKDDTELCHVCCMAKGQPNTCSSTSSERWVQYFNKKVTTLQPGSPCNDFKGYCDVFMKCRLVDADGPLARLKKAIFNPELYTSIAEWIVEHWWAVLLMGIALIMLMAGFIKICSVHTPSSNPKLPPPRPLPGTLKRRRNPAAQTQPQHHRQQRENYQMGQMRH